MASSKKSTTSKTARVMNLLSKSREYPPAEQIAEPVAAPEVPAPVAQPPQPAPDASAAAPDPAPAPAATPSPMPAAPTVPASPAPAHSTPTPPLISSMQADSAISHQVMSALESALDAELGIHQNKAPTPAAAAPAPVMPAEAEPAVLTEPEPEPIASSDPMEEVPPSPAPVTTEIPSEPLVVSEPTIEAIETVEDVTEIAADPIMESMQEEASVSPPPVSEPIPEAAPAAPVEPILIAQDNDAPSPVSAPSVVSAPPTQFKIDSDTTYVNVMESLVEEKANKYIDMFGLCKCPRCVADVKAYALNHLNPKYVVMHTGEVIPRITLYENKFSAAVTAQILNACKIVMDHPRHEDT